MEQLFTKKEAARYLKVSVRTVTRMVSDLEVPIYKVGHQVRIPASSINKLLKGPSSEENLNKIIYNLLAFEVTLAKHNVSKTKLYLI